MRQPEPDPNPARELFFAGGLFLLQFCNGRGSFTPSTDTNQPTNTMKTIRIVRKNHLQIISAARNAGKIVTEYMGGTFTVQTPGSKKATAYHPDGHVYRVTIA